MTDGMRESHSRLHEAFDGLLRIYRLLEQENELLRSQLRRHPVGEMQIRETERQMITLRGKAPFATPEQLIALMTLRPD
ncbi:hypothetical protein [Dyella telluris]|uniref:DUF465 domain-containing protein n=1 Tax=Dyella telluris TaxID=2763498 RepID=A0A7G8Q2K6_9GAMM|nr:hypothetical protein [Dyella telluris]QNK01014.1 hypothetical protein H8F01_18390 [Dyella telluris]